MAYELTYMKNYSVNVDCRKLKRIPKHAFCFWLLLVVSCLFWIQEIYDTHNMLGDSYCEYELIIEEVSLCDSYSIKGARMKLSIFADGTTYYIWYPQTKYKQFADDINNDLLSGDVTSVNVMVSNTQTIREKMFSQQRIVDLRSTSAVYYDFELERDSLQKSFSWSCVLSVFSILILFLYTLCVSLLYGILSWKKHKRT